MTIATRIKNMDDKHSLFVEEWNVSRDAAGEIVDHPSTYELKPGEEYVVYVYPGRFFAVKDGSRGRKSE